MILDLARGQIGSGHQVRVACPAGSPLQQMVRAAGVAAAPLDFTRPERGRRRSSRAWPWQQRADVVNAHSSRDRKAVLWARAHGHLDAAVVFTRHVRTLTFPLRLWWQSRGVDRIIAVSGDVARRLVARGLPAPRSCGAERPAAGIPGRLARRNRGRGGARAHRPAPRSPGDRRGVAAQGAGGAAARRAARQAPAQHRLHRHPPEVALTWLGAATPQHAVTFVPFVEDPRPYYACLAISALPSRQEGLSIAQLESMALGLPFVGSRYAGIPDLVTDGVDGLLVEHGDTRAWARAIERLLDEPGPGRAPGVPRRAPGARVVHFRAHAGAHRGGLPRGDRG